MLLRALLLTIILPTLGGAHQSFQDLIPNGKNVRDPSGNSHPGVGHSRSTGGGALNNFGEDFKAEGFKWTKALCAKDSDCDGLSNGEELGDPLCTWSEGATPQFDVGITHPGIADTERSTTSTSSSGISLDTCADFSVEELPTNYGNTSFVMPSYEVPSQRTTYAKYAVKLDDVEDMYTVRFEPIIDQQVVHHILLYNCDSAPMSFLQPSTTANMPCKNLVFAWAVGGKAFCLPPKIGFEFNIQSQWYLIEVHYDNPSGLVGLKDSSGIKVTNFPKSSVSNQGFQSAAYLLVGAGLDTVTIPPKRSAYEVSAKCTFEDLPSSGVTVFSYFLHGHTIAKKIWTDVQRSETEFCPSFCDNGNCNFCFGEDGCCGGSDESICFDRLCCDECGPCYENCSRCKETNVCNPNGDQTDQALSSFDLGCNTRYDFDLQETVPLQEFQKIYPGDVLTTHCVYDSSERTSTTHGGDATEDEMCIAFYLYYPSIPESSVLCLTGNTKLDVGDGSHTCAIPGQIGYEDSACERPSENSSDSAGELPGENSSRYEYTAFQKLSTWLQIHVICLYVSWGFLLPIGVLIPMSFKDAFNDRTMWFRVHQIMQTSGTLLLIIGCSAAFANVRLHFNGTHQKLGLAVLIFAVLQILNAVFRPSKKNGEDKPRSRSRYIWELLHKNLGRLVIVMAWVNVFLGVRLLEDWYIMSPALTRGLIGVQGTIIILLTLVAVWRYMKARNTCTQNDSSAVLERPKSSHVV